MGAKDGWKFVSIDFTIVDHAVMTWERFTKLFKDEYVLQMETEHLAQEFLSLKQRTKSWTNITRMFHERALFCLEHVSTEKACVSWYLSILRRVIWEFLANSSYRTLAELQINARRREIELEIQTREEGEQ